MMSEEIVLHRGSSIIESGDSEETTVWTVLVLFLRILLVRYLA
jgi:hypothetical protein